MAELIETVGSGGLIYFTSPALTEAGFTHAFSTRMGGISAPPFDSLNLGNSATGPQDTAANIAENQRRFLAAIGAESLQLITVNQVHGADVATVGGKQADFQADAAGQDKPIPCADALVVHDAGLLAGMRTADCVPILIGSDDGRLAAAVHAGWRGLVAGVVGACIRQMVATGYPGSRLIAAVGPCIGADAYEVGAEVKDAFEHAGLGAAVKRYSKPHINLASAARIELVHAGVIRIDSSELCTYALTNYFYSHRRDHGATGRMLSVIGLEKII